MMEESEQIERLKLIFENACALSKTGDALLDSYIPSVVARIHAVLRLKDPQNPDWDGHIVDYE